MRLSPFLYFFRVFDKINVRIFAYIKRNAYLCNVVKTKGFILRWGQRGKFCI